MTHRIAPALALCFLLASGCSSTREIQTSSPRPRSDIERPGPTAATQARFAVVLSDGTTQLPRDIERFQFRIAEVQLHRRDGGWVRLPSDAAPIELVRGETLRPRTILDTYVPPARYDSLAVALSQVFVRFGENAGAPLATADGLPQKLAFSLDPSLERPTVIDLILEPGASLARTADCRWYFVPVLRMGTKTESGEARTRSY